MSAMFERLFIVFEHVFVLVRHPAVESVALVQRDFGGDLIRAEVCQVRVGLGAAQKRDQLLHGAVRSGRRAETKLIAFTGYRRGSPGRPRPFA